MWDRSWDIFSTPRRKEWRKKSFLTCVSSCREISLSPANGTLPYVTLIRKLVAYVGIDLVLHSDVAEHKHSDSAKVWVRSAAELRVHYLA